MHIVYLCNFNLENADAVGGKDRATKQKIEALKGQSSKFKAYYLSRDGDIYKILMGLWLDLCCGLCILFNRPDYFISRGAIGYFSLAMAKVVGCVSAREVHAVFSNELNLLPFGKLKKYLLNFYFKIFSRVDDFADVRIYNHPFLLDYYKKSGHAKEFDFYCYNGFAPASVVSCSKMEVYKKYNLDHKPKYLVFTGAVSKWHGVDFLINLQEEFNRKGDDIRIIIAGGDSSLYDPNKLCVNITPLGELGCGEVISISELCLLPVKHNRVSPGSPLKLYDYIAHKKYVVAENIAGYADEVSKYQIGIVVNFENPEETRNQIVKYLDSAGTGEHGYPHVPVTWDDRVSCWLENFKKINKA